MRVIKLNHFFFTLLIFGLQPSIVGAQEYYPLARGNTWHYKITAYNWGQPADTFYHQTTVIGDTLLPNGKTFWELNRFNIFDYNYARIDSNYIYYYRRQDSVGMAIFNLQSLPGTVDTVFSPAGIMHWVYMEGIDTISVFGKETPIRTYSIDGLVQYSATFADGFGMIFGTDYKDGFGGPYEWQLTGCMIGDSLYGNPVAIENLGIVPNNFELYQNYPNPFNPETTIEYSLAKSAAIRLSVVDILGREVIILAKGKRQPGKHSIKWNASNHPSGLYFVKLTIDKSVAVKRMLLLK